jgi:peptidoglycan/xylan/chitin deacetylase (PgdA/CDA1 family)
VVVLAPLLVAAELHDGPSPIAVTVEGSSLLVAFDTTFGDVARDEGLRAVDGRLLDVEGDVLDRRADPGAILVNGAVPPRSTPLAEGDVITVVDGADRTEGTRRETERLPGRQVGNPMYTLATSRLIQTTTIGRISGKVVSVRYRVVGRAKRPPAVALTFDDGPWPRSTRQILAVLERMHAKATFFMVGYLIERYPQVVRDVIDARMAIGTHSWSHPYLTPFKRLIPHRIETEITQPANLLRRRLVVRPTLFRPPGGSYDAGVIRTARDAGMRVVMWSVDPHDYLDSATPAGIARSVLGSVRPGAIVVLHDGGGDQSATVRALPRIIRGIRRMGLDLVTLA